MLPKKSLKPPRKAQQVRQVPTHSHSVGQMNASRLPNSSMNAMLGSSNKSNPNLKNRMKAKTEKQMGIKLPSSMEAAGENLSEASHFLYDGGEEKNVSDMPAAGVSEAAPQNGGKKSFFSKVWSGIKRFFMGVKNLFTGGRKKGIDASQPVAAPEDGKQQGRQFGSKEEMYKWLQERSEITSDKADKGLLTPESVINGLSKEESTALEGYSTEPTNLPKKDDNIVYDYENWSQKNWEDWSDSYKGMNNLLRTNGKVDYSKDAMTIPDQYQNRIKKKINQTTSAIQKSVMQEDEVVYRGMSRKGFMASLGMQKWPETQEEADALINMQFTDKGFSSTSTSKETAKDFAGKGAMMEVIVPAGTQAMYMESLSAFAQEKELLLQKGTTMRIVDAVLNKKEDDRLDLVVEITGQNSQMLDV